ncbi:MAG: tetratricopeptide repeat protein, partial [Gammaproteobacteria bacterium]|nr:tetratricopeptide repeat protein [Gammaproteobacteria bacterium]
IRLQAMFLQDTVDPKEAQTALYEFLREFKTSPRATLIAGTLYAQIGDLKSAKLEFRNTVEQAGFQRKILLEVTRRQIAVKDLDGAQWTLQKILTSRPNDLEAGSLYARLLLTNSRFEEARQEIDALREHHGDILTLKRLDALWWTNQREFAKAASILEQAMANEPSSTLMSELFQARMRNGDWAKGISELEAWLKAKPDDYLIVDLLAQTRLHRGEFKEAGVLYEKLHARAPTSIAILNNLAMIYQRANDPRAIKLAERAYELAPNVPAIADTYGWILTEQGQAEKGLPLLRNAFARESRDRGIRYHLALALKALGRIDEARKELEGALEGDEKFVDYEAAKALLKEINQRS